MSMMGKQYRTHKARIYKEIKVTTKDGSPEEVVASLWPHSTTPQWEKFVRSRESEGFQVKIYLIILFFYKYRCIVFN